MGAAGVLAEPGVLQYQVCAGDRAGGAPALAGVSRSAAAVWRAGAGAGRLDLQDAEPEISVLCVGRREDGHRDSGGKRIHPLHDRGF